MKVGAINWIHWIHRFADLAISIGGKRYWGKGSGQEARRLLLEDALSKSNLNHIILGVYADYKQALKAYQKVGFKVEGRKKSC